LVANPSKSALIVGVTGVIGRGLNAHLYSLPDWRVTGMSRRPPANGSGHHVSVDLLDPNSFRESLNENLSALEDVTHIFFCGFLDAPSQAAQVAPNLAMLRNLIEIATPHMPALERVVLNEGNKWYGSHLGPFRTPAKEDDTRCPPPMFYHDQEDFLRAHAQTRDWTWAALRPHTVCGFSIGSPMNIMTAIAVYAAIRKHQGLAFNFPGKPGACSAVYQLTDAAHLAKAQTWAATAPDAANQAFNITNGDFFRWENVWPRLAEFFGMETGPVETIRLADEMPSLEPVWNEIVARHDLEPHAYSNIVAWPFADYVFGRDWDVMTATTKIRQTGFHDVVDSEDMLADILTRFRRDRIIP
jgi:nucleoside-diphosphate-sugar epimerase